MGSVSSVDEDIDVASVNINVNVSLVPAVLQMIRSCLGREGWNQMRRKRKSVKNNRRMMILSER